MGRRFTVLVLAGAALGCPLAASNPSEGGGPCPSGMAYVDGGEGSPNRGFCIDRWEASVVEVRGREELAHSPYESVAGLTVKAVSRSGVVPQGYISKVEAETACTNAKKRLCSSTEWQQACRGRKPTVFPYGDERKAGYCNDSGRAPLATLYPELGDGVYASAPAMNDPRINRAPGTVAPTGKYSHCRNAYGVYDLVGNLHEWTSDVTPYKDGSHAATGRGTFRGGYYQDTHRNGDGCNYRTVAHDVTYHDYSTGFRCCADGR